MLSEEDDVLSKLALSNGLADSVKIATLENFIDDYIERVKDIPPILESGRRLPIRFTFFKILIGAVARKPSD